MVLGIFSSIIKHLVLNHITTHNLNHFKYIIPQLIYYILLLGL